MYLMGEGLIIFLRYLFDSLLTVIWRAPAMGHVSALLSAFARIENWSRCVLGRFRMMRASLPERLEPKWQFRRLRSCVVVSLVLVVWFLGGRQGSKMMHRDTRKPHPNCLPNTSGCWRAPKTWASPKPAFLIPPCVPNPFPK